MGGVWMTQWTAISARISALLDAGSFLLRTRDGDTVTPKSPFKSGVQPGEYIAGAAELLSQHAKQVENALQVFFKSHGDHLADTPRKCLSSFLEVNRYAFGEPDGLAGMTVRITALASFRAEFEYLIADTEALTKSLVVRAFTHLQSSIAADRSVRDCWKHAYHDGGEIACERLGACHLLLHGVWSFKAHGQGARTDLVLGELRENWDEARRAATGLILTEWKRVVGEDSEDVEVKANEARVQAENYCAEALAGFEVVYTRYVVLVSEGRLRQVPNEVIEGNKVYKHFNVAVDPWSPSKDARKRPVRK